MIEKNRFQSQNCGRRSSESLDNYSGAITMGKVKADLGESCPHPLQNQGLQEEKTLEIHFNSHAPGMLGLQCPPSKSYFLKYSKVIFPW